MVGRFASRARRIGALVVSVALVAVLAEFASAAVAPGLRARTNPQSRPAPSATATPPAYALYGGGYMPIPPSSSSSAGYVTDMLVFDGGKALRSARLRFPEDYSFYYEAAPFVISDKFVFQADATYHRIYAWQIGTGGITYSFKRLGVIQAMAADAAGALYVLDTGRVFVYKPRHVKPDLTIVDGASGATSIVVDRLGYLYVGGPNGVSVYAAGSATPMETITQGIDGFVSMAVGGKERLYVASSSTDAITAYAFGSTTSDETITAGLQSVGSIAVGPTGTLYADAGGGTITEYDKGGTTLSRTISLPGCCGAAIVVGPDDTLFALASRIYSFPSQATQWKQQIRLGFGYQLGIGPPW